MSVIRLELAVPDDAAYDVAAALSREYSLPARLPEGCTATRIIVLSDAVARRERALLEAAGCFFRPEMSVPDGRPGS